jgi:hypothetical protein
MTDHDVCNRVIGRLAGRVEALLDEKENAVTIPATEMPSVFIGKPDRTTPCCSYKFELPDRGPIFWNPYNMAVQCHHCGAAFDERKVQVAQGAAL